MSVSGIGRTKAARLAAAAELGKRISLKPLEPDMHIKDDQDVAALLMEEQSRIKLLRIAVPDTFVEHGDVDTLYRVLGMDADTVTNRICEGL